MNRYRWIGRWMDIDAYPDVYQDIQINRQIDIVIQRQICRRIDSGREKEIDIKINRQIDIVIQRYRYSYIEIDMQEAYRFGKRKGDRYKDKQMDRYSYIEKDIYVDVQIR